MKKPIFLLALLFILSGCSPVSSTSTAASAQPSSSGNSSAASASSAAASSASSSKNTSSSNPSPAVQNTPLLATAQWVPHTFRIQSSTFSILLPEGFSVATEPDLDYADIVIDQDQDKDWNAVYGVPADITKIGSIITSASPYNTTSSYHWVSNELYRQENPLADLPFSDATEKNTTDENSFTYTRQTNLEYGTFYPYAPYLVFTGGATANPYLLTTFVDFNAQFEIWLANVYSLSNTQTKEYYESIVSSLRYVS